MRGVFVAGTDTEVGKTLIAAGVLRFLRRQGINAVSMKPVQTGAETDGDGTLLSIDLAFHLEAAGFAPPEEDRACMAPYAYEPAASPHLAGRLEGRYPDLARITVCAETLLKRYDFLVVEGAGGLMVPITESALLIDLMRVLDFPVLLVARAGLGTINHSLLSLAALRAAGLHVLGIVFNDLEPEPNPLIREDNPRTVATFGDVEIFGEVPYLPIIEPGDVESWQRFEQATPGLTQLLDYAKG